MFGEVLGPEGKGTPSVSRLGGVGATERVVSEDRCPGLGFYGFQIQMKGEEFEMGKGSQGLVDFVRVLTSGRIKKTFKKL